MRSCLALAFALMVLAGCSGSSNDAASPAASPATSGSAVDEADTGEEDDASPSSTTSADVETATSTPPPPLESDGDVEPAPEGAEDSTTAWISRLSMSESSIEVIWPGTDDAVEYQLHRVPYLSDVRPNPSEMTASNLIHTGQNLGEYLDTTVTANERYWYGIRGLDANGTVLSTGWHPMAAVTDEEPPAKVELNLEVVDGTVMLSWNQPAENFALDSFRILRAIGDEEPEVVANTWNIEQTSFVDNAPPQAVVTYSVVAFDFHWNPSEPTEVTIDLS